MSNWLTLGQSWPKDTLSLTIRRKKTKHIDKNTNINPMVFLTSHALRDHIWVRQIGPSIEPTNVSTPNDGGKKLLGSQVYISIYMQIYIYIYIKKKTHIHQCTSWFHLGSWLVGGGGGASRNKPLEPGVSHGKFDGPICRCWRAA